MILVCGEGGRRVHGGDRDGKNGNGEDGSYDDGDE